MTDAAGGEAGASLRRPSWLVAYAAPALPLSMPVIPLVVVIPSFYAEALGAGLAATGLALFAARALDVLTDPVIGHLSDRGTGRFGRRKPWIIAGGLLGAFALVLLFAPPSGAGAGHLLVWSAVLYLAWTMVSIPYTAWGAELSDDYHMRSRITGLREALGISGIILAGIVPFAVSVLGGDQAQGLEVLAWTVVGLGTFTLAWAAWRVPDGAGRKTGGTPLEPRRVLRAMTGNGPFLRLMAAWMVNGLATGLPAALFPLYVTHVLALGESARAGLILVYFACAVAAVPLWVWLARRHGKHRAWCFAMLAACAAFIWTPILGPGDGGLFLAVCIVTGAALGADLALPPAMQADVVDFDTLRHGERRAGLFFAVWSMGTKLSLALAVGLAFPLLDLMGFRTQGNNSAFALLVLAVLYGLAPTLLKALAIRLVWDHPITARRQAAIRRRIMRMSAPRTGSLA